jgi:hypothetical protein
MYNLLVQYKQHIHDNMKIQDSNVSKQYNYTNCYTLKSLISPRKAFLCHTRHKLKMNKRNSCTCAKANIMVWRPTVEWRYCFHIHNFSIRWRRVGGFKLWTLYLLPVPSSQETGWAPELGTFSWIPTQISVCFGNGRGRVKVTRYSQLIVLFSELTNKFI